MKSAVAVLAAGLAMVLGSLVGQSILTSQDARLRKLFETNVDELAGYHVTARSSDAVATVERRTGERIARLQPFVDSLDNAVLKTVHAVAAVSDKDGLTCGTLSVRRGHVVVRGLAPNWNGCANLKTALVHAGSTVKLDRSEDLVDEMVPFTLTAERLNE